MIKKILLFIWLLFCGNAAYCARFAGGANSFSPQEINAMMTFSLILLAVYILLTKIDWDKVNKKGDEILDKGLINLLLSKNKKDQDR